jgi:hypothetical protein
VPVAAPWQPVAEGVTAPVDPAATHLRLRVRSGGCVEVGGRLTGQRPLDRVVVDETADAVTITTWRGPSPEPHAGGSCAGVGLQVRADAALSAPLGRRRLIDGYCEAAGEAIRDLPCDPRRTMVFPVT